MTCPHPHPHPHQLSAYADHEMPPAETAQLHGHLQNCLACQQQLDAITALSQRLRALPSPALGFDLAGQWDERLRSAAQPLHRPPHRLWAHWRGWMPTGLAAGLALASGVWLGGLWLGAGMAVSPTNSVVRVFGPVRPGGLWAACEICRLSQGMR